MVNLKPSNINGIIENSIYGQWKIADIDGFFSGNKFFRPIIPFNVYQKEIPLRVIKTDNEKYF